jgi:hypothetical protein
MLPLQASRLHALGISTYVLATSSSGSISDALTVEVTAIATDPDSKYLITSSFTAMGNFGDTLVDGICEISSMYTSYMKHSRQVPTILREVGPCLLTDFFTVIGDFVATKYGICASSMCMSYARTIAQ